MLPKIGIYKFDIESYLCDFKGNVRLSLIGDYILHAATLHAQERGFGYEEMIKDNCTWVLSRMVIEIFEYPQTNDTLVVETWVENVSRFFTQRCFRFLNQNQKIIGYAHTIWAAININTRKPIDILAWSPEISSYVGDIQNFPIEKNCKIPQVHNDNPVFYIVKYSDIDINKHTNSVRYMEHNMDMFDFSILNEKNIRRFEIMYSMESNFGDKLSFYKQEINPNEFLIEIKKEDVSICRSKIIWE